MALPKLKSPTFKLTLPGCKKDIIFRPFLVQEEKILLIAQESRDFDNIIRSIKQVLENCLIEGDINIDHLATFDLEYYFLNLRAKSVNNVLKLSISDPDNESSKYNVELNIDDVNVKFDDDHTNQIQLSDDLGVVLNYPNYHILQKFPNLDKMGASDVFNIICECIDNVYDAEEVYDFKSETREEQMAFLESLSVEHANKLRAFFDTMPSLEHTITVTRTDNTSFTITLKGLADFFMYA